MAFLLVHTTLPMYKHSRHTYIVHISKCLVGGSQMLAPALQGDPEISMEEKHIEGVAPWPCRLYHHHQLLHAQ